MWLLSRRKQTIDLVNKNFRHSDILDIGQHTLIMLTSGHGCSSLRPATVTAHKIMKFKQLSSYKLLRSYGARAEVPSASC